MRIVATPDEASELNILIERGKVAALREAGLSEDAGEVIDATGYVVLPGAAKAGLIGITIGLSVQMDSFVVLVNAVAPGSTGTGRPIDLGQLAAFTDGLLLGVGGPEPIAHACLYLARPSGDWVSGAVMNVSSGWVHG